MADDFENWTALRDLSVSKLPRYGLFPAVYALRDCATGEVLKYGNAGGWLRTRIIGQYLGGYEGKPDRIHTELSDNRMIDCVEIAWIEAETAEEARTKEREFIQRYKETHDGQRPKWNLRD